MTSIFFFGSLMDKDILEVVLDRTVSNNDLSNAELFGYYKSRVDNENFPVLLPCEYSTVDGLLITGLDQTDVHRLQYFETRDYILSPVTVKANGYGFFNTKYFATSKRLVGNGKVWNFEKWLEEEKELCLELAKEIMSYYGDLPISFIEYVWEDMKRSVGKKLLFNY